MTVKLNSLQKVIALLEIAKLATSMGNVIKGMTQEQVDNWSFRQCPHCKMWHDNTESKYCSSWCEGTDTGTLTTTFCPIEDLKGES